MLLESRKLKHVAAVGGASGWVTEGSVLPRSTKESGEEHQLHGGSIASSDGSKFDCEVRCQKRYFIARIGELGRAHCVPIGEKIRFAKISLKF